ncbi:hypothetical protein TSTA_061820 [Talaromyces stipitatus ATCC 10500]|uniref:NACHT LRR and PYD domain-containing protein n=1 Tax=Talaromyces stipitatus (strain ATCC 10500 / CBS 375.48 / QM 6759 / NRRL 1006) TaxID=441959 RepID=B8LX44_TALSN|nr:uncharacterized protein TSTA_061820 [Talaromyces stipitatus ATCC 10500]EED22694.1 hypothetical protein TSTA_061820 [Talaromyces stipitatus ATCC 10500]
MTAVYQAIELKLWKKDILNLEKRNNTGYNGGTAVRKLRTRLQIESQHMKTEIDIIEFDPGHRDWLYEQPEFCEMSDDVLDRLSFLRTSDTSDWDKSYHFLHLTFQEFFAAQYFVRCWRSESSKPLTCLKAGFVRENYIAKISPERFLREEKYSGRYDVFWRFVTGLLYSTGREQLYSFLKQMDEEPRDLLGPAHQRLLMHCFSEVPRSEDSGMAKDLREKMELGCIQWSYYEDMSLGTMRLCSETEFPEHVLCKLLEDSLQKKTSRRILEALAHRWHISRNLMDRITIFMDDGDSHVRRAAINALGRQSSWSPEILEAVMRRLDDEDTDVRRAAISALGRQSPWSPEILEAVMRRLSDRDLHVRYAVIDAVGRQSPWSPEIVEAVIHRFNLDEGLHMGDVAIDALSTQSPWSPEILEAIMRRLDDEEIYVRQAAIDALSTQSPWSPETLEAVMRRLDDEDSDIRHTAIDALSRQSPWSPKILEAVMRRLDNKESDVRDAIIYALGTQSPWSPEILKAVMRQLDDEVSDVRRAAISALGKQSPWSSEILKAVMHRLDNDGDSYVASKIEALLWKHDEFLFLFFDLNANATSALCKIWARRSIHKIFACYVRDGSAYFETSDGRSSIPLSKEKIKLLKRTLRAATDNNGPDATFGL